MPSTESPARASGASSPGPGARVLFQGRGARGRVPTLHYRRYRVRSAEGCGTHGGVDTGEPQSGYRGEGELPRLPAGGDRGRGQGPHPSTRTRESRGDFEAGLGEAGWHPPGPGVRVVRQPGTPSGGPGKRAFGWTSRGAVSRLATSAAKLPVWRRRGGGRTEWAIETPSGRRPWVCTGVSGGTEDRAMTHCGDPAPSGRGASLRCPHTTNAPSMDFCQRREGVGW